MYKKILIANNGSKGAFKALVEALRLAHSHGSETHMIYVEEDIAWNSPETSGGKRTLDRKFAELVTKAEAEAKHHGVKLKSHMVLGRPAEAIADFLLSRGASISLCWIQRPFGALPQDSWQDWRPSCRSRTLRGPRGEMSARKLPTPTLAARDAGDRPILAPYWMTTPRSGCITALLQEQLPSASP